MLKVSEAYFQSLISTGLLSAENAAETLFTLSSFWSHRVNESIGSLNLSPFEYNVELVITYFAGVSNGGHCQFLINNAISDNAKVYISDTLIALNSVGFESTSEFFLQALNVCKPVTPANQNQVYEAFTSLPKEILSQFDAKVDLIIPSADLVIANYINDHQQHFLIPERGLGN